MNLVQKGALLAVFGLMAGVAQAGTEPKLQPFQLIPATSDALTSFSKTADSKNEMLKVLADAPSGVYRIYRQDGAVALGMVELAIQDQMGNVVRSDADSTIFSNRIAIGAFEEYKTQAQAVQERAGMVFSKESFGKLSPSNFLGYYYYIEQISGDEPGFMRNDDRLVVITIPDTREACVVINDKKAAVLLPRGNSWQNIMGANCKKIELGSRTPFGDAKVDAVILQKLGNPSVP